MAGAGIVGLTCAHRLAEAGHRVDVVARDLPRETTSALAPAVWYPDVADSSDRVAGWAATTYDAFARLAAASPDCGVRMLEGTQVHLAEQPDPWWREVVPYFEHTATIPDRYRDGWRFRLPVVDMPVYLDWLVDGLERRGVTMTRLNLQALPDGADLVVNATGLGGRHFAEDPSLEPVAGQVVQVEQFGLDRWWLDLDGPTFVVPRGDCVVVGGTAVEGTWNRTPDPAVADDILARAGELVPEVLSARVLRHKVGLCPARPTVRLERVDRVIHCYGHGGSGVTLSWGCADEVAVLAAG